eukprot:4798851-Amphidinium_carterae.1
MWRTEFGFGAFVEGHFGLGGKQKGLHMSGSEACGASGHGAEYHDSSGCTAVPMEARLKTGCCSESENEGWVEFITILASFVKPLLRKQLS